MIAKRLAALFLALLLIPSLTLCEALDSAYTPGNITRNLFTQAFDRGDMILANMQFGLTPSSNAEAVWGSDAAALLPFTQLLPNACLTAGAGKVEDGIRLALGAQYAQDDSHSAEIVAEFELTKQGIAITSSVIPGERFSSTWESLFASIGLSEQETIAFFLLDSLDLKAIAHAYAAQLPALTKAAVQLITPYGETILSHITSLPIQRSENVPAEGDYPAAATELYIPISMHDIGTLIDKLAAQLQQDTTLRMLLDAALAQSGETVTAADLCAAVREAASSMTNDTALIHIYVGLDQQDNPLYLHTFIGTDNGASIILSCIRGKGEAPESTALEIDLIALTSEETIDTGVSFAFEFFKDPSDSLVFDFVTALVTYEDNAPAGKISICLTNTAAPTEDEQPGYTGYVMFQADAGDEAAESITLYVDFMQSKTADGGEQMAAAGTIELLTQANPFSAGFESHMIAKPSANDPTISMTEFFRLPALGIDEYYQNTTFYTAAYSSEEQLAETSLETATSEELEALAGRAASSLEATLRTLLDLLPGELAEAIR